MGYIIDDMNVEYMLCGEVFRFVYGWETSFNGKGGELKFLCGKNCSAYTFNDVEVQPEEVLAIAAYHPDDQETADMLEMVRASHPDDPTWDTLCKAVQALRSLMLRSGQPAYGP